MTRRIFLADTRVAGWQEKVRQRIKLLLRRSGLRWVSSPYVGPDQPLVYGHFERVRSTRR